MDGDKELSTGWSLWEHQRNLSNNYDQNSCCIGSFYTIQDFWRYYNNYPKPSEVFFDGNCKPVVKNPDREIASLSLFRINSEPKWEHDSNKDGGEVAVRKFKNVSQLDYYWLLLSMFCIGEQSKHCDKITGIRIVDSSIPNNRRKLHRIELWFSALDIKNEIDLEFRNLLKLEPFIQTYFKEHSTAVETTK